MHLSGFALAAAAALTSGVLASNMVDELHGHFHQRADVHLTPRQTNLQTFTGALGGIKANAVSVNFMKKDGLPISIWDSC